MMTGHCSDLCFLYKHPLNILGNISHCKYYLVLLCILKNATIVHHLAKVQLHPYLSYIHILNKS